MATNKTVHVVNSTQSPLSYVCSLMGMFAWQQRYLTPTTFITFIFVASVEALTCPLTILLNAMVILTMLKRKRYLRKKKPYVLLACLAVTDLLVGAVVKPLIITSHVQHILGVGPICLIDKVAFEITYLACAASLFHLVIVSGERYIAIKYALRYETLVTTRRLTISVTVAWAVPIIMTLASLAFDVAGEIILRDQLLGMVATLVMLSSVLVISFFQVAVFLDSRRHRQHIKAHQISESNAKEFLEKDKAARTTAIIVGALCFCFAPQIIYVALLSVKYVNYFSGWMHVIDVLVYSNSLINPIIYCVRTQECRRALRELLNLTGPPINAEIEMRNVNRPRGQRKDGTACTDLSHTKKHMASSPCGFRSRSLDLSKDSKDEPRSHRIKSI